MSTVKLLLLAAVVLAFSQINDWAVLDRLMAALLALLVVAYLWSRLSLRGLAVTRELASDRAQVGQFVAERLEIRNRARLGKLWLEARDYSTLPNHQASRVVNVRGRGGVAWQVETSCARRGRFRLGPLVVRSGDPFGIFPATLSVPSRQEMIVYPATVDLAGFALPAGILAGGSAMERRNPFVTPSVAGVRDYAPGDAFNRISWSATARLGRIMVKEFDLDPTADVWIVLDLDQHYHVRATRPPAVLADTCGRWPVEAWLDSTEEYGITIAASLARLCLKQGRNVGVIASAAHHEVIPADRSHRQEVKILESLAVLWADGQHPLAEVLLAEGRRFGRQSSVMVVTSSTDDAWAPTLAEIVGRHVRAAVILVEPDTFGQAESSLLVVSSLLAAGIPTHLVKYGDDIAATLASPQAAVRAAAGPGRRPRG